MQAEAKKLKRCRWWARDHKWTEVFVVGEPAPRSVKMGETIHLLLRPASPGEGTLWTCARKGCYVTMRKVPLP